MKIFLLQTRWDSCYPQADNLQTRRYFKTKRGAEKAEKQHRKHEQYLGSRIVKVKVEE